jgi:S1/P1 Nuclease
MNKLPRFAALAALTMTAHQAHAWDDFGHMVVAAVAYEQIKATPVVRAKVDTLIKLNPQYGVWTVGVPAAQRGQVAFLMAARWADAIKGDPAYSNDGSNNGETPVEPVASQNIGYKDKNRHKYWHYKDIGFSTDNTPVEPAKVPNVQTQIERFRATLAFKPATQDLKSYDLVWLLHLVGDAHQPLHATSRFTQDEPHGDIGGNTVRVSCATAAVPAAEAASPPPVIDAAAACPNKLHAFWDDALGQQKDTSSAITRAQTLPAAPSALAGITNVDTWLQESLALAQQDVYVGPVGAQGTGPYVLDAAYAANAETQSAQRVALAGTRLARLILAALK